jgi:hypothetical protein
MLDTKTDNFLLSLNISRGNLCRNSVLSHEMDQATRQSREAAQE